MIIISKVRHNSYNADIFMYKTNVIFNVKSSEMT